MNLCFRRPWFIMSAVLVITRHDCLHLDMTCTCWVPTILMLTRSRKVEVIIISILQMEDRGSERSTYSNLHSQLGVELGGEPRCLDPRPMLFYHAFQGRAPSQWVWGFTLNVAELQQRCTWLSPDHHFGSLHSLSGSSWWSMGREG